MMNDFLELENKHILVTGATSGIGQQTAILVSKYGARVTIIGRREDKLQETLSMLDGKGHHSVAFDLSQIEAIESKIKCTVDQSGPFDGYV